MQHKTQKMSLYSMYINQTGNQVKISVCEGCGDVYEYTGYPTCPECIRDGDTTKKSTDIPKLLQKEQDALQRTTT